MSDWLAWLRELDQPAALVSILATEGSAPRGAGTRMLVTAAASTGTIGGGQLEYRAIEQARLLLGHPPGDWRVQDYPLGPLLGQCCGGRVRLLVEHLDSARLDWLGEAEDGRTLTTRLGDGHVERQIGGGVDSAPGASGERPDIGATFGERLGPARRPLYLFGAGHVGKAIADHVERLPLHLCWFDTRPSIAAATGATLLSEEVIEQCVADMPDDAMILIMTHDHGLDYRLARAALGRGPLALVGLIGSKTKRARFSSRLARDGIGEDAIARLSCPIGIASIVGKEPDVIAISVLAQLLQLGV